MGKTSKHIKRYCHKLDVFNIVSISFIAFLMTIDDSNTVKSRTLLNNHIEQKKGNDSVY